MSAIPWPAGAAANGEWGAGGEEKSEIQPKR
jgi:hypothetical protein